MFMINFFLGLFFYFLGLYSINDDRTSRDSVFLLLDRRWFEIFEVCYLLGEQLILIFELTNLFFQRIYMFLFMY